MSRRAKGPDALQGTLDLLILAVINRQPMHGFGIAARIQEISDDVLRVEEGSLYPALHRTGGLDCCRMGHYAKQSSRTGVPNYSMGQKQLNDERAKWDRLSKAVGKILRFA